MLFSCGGFYFRRGTNNKKTGTFALSAPSMTAHIPTCGFGVDDSACAVIDRAYIFGSGPMFTGIFSAAKEGTHGTTDTQRLYGDGGCSTADTGAHRPARSRTRIGRNVCIDPWSQRHQIRLQGW